jgi:hypothetical protein
MMQPKSEVEGLKFTLESHWGKSPFKGWRIWSPMTTGNSNSKKCIQSRSM